MHMHMHMHMPTTYLRSLLLELTHVPSSSTPSGRATCLTTSLISTKRSCRCPVCSTTRHTLQPVHVAHFDPLATLPDIWRAGV